MRSKAFVISVFIVSVLVIGVVAAAYAVASPTCEGRAMAPDDTCVVIEGGQQLAHGYDELQEGRAGRAVAAAAVALLLLGGCAATRIRGRSGAELQ